MHNRPEVLPRTADRFLTQEQLSSLSLQLQSLFDRQPDPDEAVEQLIVRVADADLEPPDWNSPEPSTVGLWLIENPLTEPRLHRESVLRSLTNSELPPPIALVNFLDALTAKHP